MRIAALAAVVFASLPGGVRGCDYLACPGDQLMDRLLADDDLCGDSPTAVECRQLCPKDADHFFWNREQIYEQAVFLTSSNEAQAGDPVEHDYWLIGQVFPGEYLVSRAPPAYGVSYRGMAGALRSDSRSLMPKETGMSAYMLVSDVRDACILDMAIVWSWTVTKLSGPIAEDFEAAIKVVGRKGSCPGPSAGYPGLGEAWKIGGRLLRPG